MKLYKGFTDQIEYVAYTAIEYVPVEEWAKIQVVCKNVNMTTECFCMYWLKGQAEFEDYFEPDEYLEEEDTIREMLDDIKLAMSHQTPEEGSWLCATVNISPDGSYDYAFDYDEEPEFEDEFLDDEDWLKEWEYFPRTRQYMPDWWLTIMERNGMEVGDTLPPDAIGPAPEPPLSS